MLMYDVIEKKKQKGALSREEIEFWVKGVTSGAIPDYQSAALLMAICINGLNEEETVILTEAMRDSGEKADRSCYGGKAVDKHSTGGVGDKTSLVVLPLVVSLGCIGAKMSGRALGHTGGTVDKLESIPGYRTELSEQEFRDVVASQGIAIVGQSGNFAPADKKLYALRDVTATVDCVPLIASSIMSKKLAAGADIIVLDVKCGSGAFMKTYDDAKELAECMVSIGKGCGKKCAAIISDMDVPLGQAIGCALEVKEAIKLLGNDKGCEELSDLRENCLKLAENIVSLCFDIPLDEARRRCEENLINGKAYETFCGWIKAQGGDLSFLDDIDSFCKAKYCGEYKAKKSGMITKMNTESIGKSGVVLGAGRLRKGDPIDFSAGLIMLKKTGGTVDEGEVIARLYSSVKKDFSEAEELLDGAIEIV
jgi:pyrimidine-nucleoside phosphorylase